MLFSLIAAAGLSVPHQPPVPEFSLESCRAYYSPADFVAMAAVTEIREARETFPASYMFVPSDGAPHPGVVWLHGSEGGRWSVGSMCKARYLATQGFATLFFCYSDCGDDAVPESISAVDLRRTYQAMTWLKSSPYVAGQKIALSGGSRGAEQTLVLASFLARRKGSDPTLVLPDVVFAHAPFGKIVGAFNWRFFFPDEKEWRWNAALEANMSCLRDDPNGVYTYVSAAGVERHLAWKTDDAACSDKPALSIDDCWVLDPNGPYTDEQGAHYTWKEALCGLPSWQPDSDTSNPAWTWGGSLDDLTPESDIPLEAYQGDVLISQGSLDEVWDINKGLKYLAGHLDQTGVAYHLETIPALETLPSPMPRVSTERVLLEIFDKEKHGYSSLAAQVERALGLSFLERLRN